MMHQPARIKVIRSIGIFLMADAEATESWPGEDCVTLLKKVIDADYGTDNQEWERVDADMEVDACRNIVRQRYLILPAQAYINSHDWFQSRTSWIL